MDTLISFGTLAALFYSLWALYVGDQDLYFETGSVSPPLFCWDASPRAEAGRAGSAPSIGDTPVTFTKLPHEKAEKVRLQQEGKRAAFVAALGMSNPMIAAGAMAVSSVSVVGIV